MNILISSCLLGQYCRYDGKTKTYEAIEPLLNRHDIHFIPICRSRPVSSDAATGS